LVRQSFITLILAGIVVASGVTQPGPPLTGAWEGQLLLNSNWRFMEADFGATGNPADARVDLPQERRQFAEFSVDGQSVRWTLVRGQSRIRFEGTRTRDNDVIRGYADQNGVAGEFQLIRIAAGKQRDTAPYAGTYRTSAGDLVTVARFDFGDGIDRLALLDERRGYWGTLMPTGKSDFLFAPARSGRFPVGLRVIFEGSISGRATQLAMEGPGKERVVARRVDLYDASDVTFTNGTVTLAGTVIRSRAAGPRPAVVMVHSSGNQSRNGPIAYFRLIANLLAANGITTLVYDKRGVGSSTGSWPTATYADLARDLRAAVDAVRRSPGVDPTRVGIWSLSQGGWVAPLVATTDERLRFLVLVSGAATSPAQQEIDRVAAVMRAAGSPQADVAAASSYLRLFFDVSAGTRPWSDLQAEMTRTANAPWVSYVPRPRTERETTWTPEPATLDPAAIFHDVRAPVLAVHGAEDVDVPAKVNSVLFARLSGHRNSRQQIFPRADHYLLVRIADPDREYRRLSPGYLPLLVDWIRSQSVAPAR
jgi:pimeloyl-ACP methyl ester carboxylesterase